MKKILAADDDYGMRALYAELFSDAGYEVQTAADGAAALELFKAMDPDLLVLDVDMPSEGGDKVFDVTRGLLKTGKPVIFVTGHPEKVLDRAFFHTRVVVMQKPVAPEKLLAEAERLTGGK